MTLLNIITLDLMFFILALGIILFFIIYFLLTIASLKGEILSLTNKVNSSNITLVEKDGALREKDLIINSIRSEIQVKAQEIGLKMLDNWKLAELEAYKKKADEAGLDTAKLMLQRWIIQEEDRIRKDAANRSVRVVLGKVTEHLIPFSDGFSQFNPKDARFIGSPIDLIVFDGIEEKADEITIYFIEIKTGGSALSQKQKKVMEAVKEKRVEWLRFNIKDFGDEVNAEL